MKLDVENDFQHKIMTQSFAEPVTLATPADVQQWRAQWMTSLSSWHSPYKLVVDCTNLTVAPSDEVKKALDVMLKFFKGFFLRQATGFGMDAAKGHEALPFPVHPDLEAAEADVGVRLPKKREPTDFRSTIQIQNHFQQHTIEINFAEPVVLDTKEKVATLKSKLTNTLMQWHSKWNLLIDCANLDIAPEMKPELEKTLKVLRGFFMKDVIGYAPRGRNKEQYPFDTYLARHKAAAVIEGEGNLSADKADCKARK